MRVVPLSLRLSIAPFALLAAMVIAIAISGCHSDAGQPLTESQKQGADRLATISKSSGGDWDKVSQADKDYIIKNVANGDEHTAKMLIAPPPGAGGAKMGPPGAPGAPPGAPPGMQGGR